MPLYALPSIYLGSDQEARELLAYVKTISKKEPRFTSQNDFLKHCIRFTIEHDPDLKKVKRQLARAA